MKQRVIGLDFARALAIFGMVIVNFKVAMGAETGSEILVWFTGLFQGRASALFVILAGIGVTFLTKKALLSRERVQVRQARLALVKRGLLLIAIGLAYTPVWEADILHFYGFYFLIAALVFTTSEKCLLLVALSVVLLFPCLMLVFNYEQNWNWSTLVYENLWTIDGMVMRIGFNGFHPIFPWAAFLLFGMWLGRQDLADNTTRKRLFYGAFITLVLIETGCYLMRFALGGGSDLGMTSEEVAFLFSTSIIPPLPQYMLSAGSSATMILIASLIISDKFSNARIIHWLCQTGKLSLTLYVAHVIIGMGTLEAIGRLENQSIGFSLYCALLFCVCAVVVSVLCLTFFRCGPLEWVFRKVSS